MFSYWIRVADTIQLAFRPNTKDKIIRSGGTNKNYEFPNKFRTVPAGIVQTFANMAHRFGLR